MQRRAPRRCTARSCPVRAEASVAPPSSPRASTRLELSPARASRARRLVHAFPAGAVVRRQLAADVGIGEIILNRAESLRHRAVDDAQLVERLLVPGRQRAEQISHEHVVRRIAWKSHLILYKT